MKAARKKCRGAERTEIRLFDGVYAKFLISVMPEPFPPAFMSGGDYLRLVFDRSKMRH
jgi:hypothetical protein